MSRNHLKTPRASRCQLIFRAGGASATPMYLDGTSRSDGDARAENHWQPTGLWPVGPIAALSRGPRRPCYCDPRAALHSNQLADNAAYEGI